MQTSGQFDSATRIGYLASRETVSRIRIRWNSYEGVRMEDLEEKAGFYRLRILESSVKILFRVEWERRIDLTRDGIIVPLLRGIISRENFLVRITFVYRIKCEASMGRIKKNFLFT